MKKIFVYNNLTKVKEALELSNPPNLNIYTCGPTVYDHSHIGHARAAITWDFIVRFLRVAGYNVIWTRNITDIDDKIINKAKEINLHPDKVARIFTYSFHEDMQSLNVDWPDFEPRATQYITQMQDFINILIQKGFAYQTENDVYFSIQSFKTYGHLKGQTISELEKGFGRIEPNLKKRHPLDFALWKAVLNQNEYGFDSPWGKGRPGWHLECSTMNYSIYGDKLDIHSGGDDLIFPHHENEIAQSEAFTKKQFAKYWLHNGMIMVDGKKMAKSEGNFITIKDALKHSTGNALRLFVLNTHYKMLLNYTNEAITSAQNGVNRLLEALGDLDIEKTKRLEETADNKITNNEYIEDFFKVMADDFNSPKALSVLFKIVDCINSEKNENNKLDLQILLYHLLTILGFDLTVNNINKNLKDKIINKITDKLIMWRLHCRESKDYKSADRIRDILNECNIEVKDLSNNKFKWQIRI